MKRFVLAALALVTLSSTAMAQTQDTQKFTVLVPGAISIVAPGDTQIIHDESENDQTFASQGWLVSGNVLAGVAVSISTDDWFQHTTDPTGQRDAKIDLSVGSTTGAANWTITQASAQTDYSNTTKVATVQATSDNAGSATLNVDMTFITDGFGSFPAGNYETTVTGTVASN